MGHPSDLASWMTACVFSNENLNDMKIVKSLEESGLLIKGFSETVENEVKEQVEWYFRYVGCNISKRW